MSDTQLNERLDNATENAIEEFRGRWTNYYECGCVGLDAPCRHEEKFNKARSALRDRVRELEAKARDEGFIDGQHKLAEIMRPSR